MHEYGILDQLKPYFTVSGVGSFNITNPSCINCKKVLKECFFQRQLISYIMKKLAIHVFSGSK